MPWTRPLHPLTLIAIITMTTGCQTTVGNYFANRGRDFGDCFLLQAGIGLGIGVDVKAAGLLHAGALFSQYIPGRSIGCVYGDLRPACTETSFVHLPAEGDFGLLVAHFSIRSLDGTAGSHLCPALLPALFSWEGPDGGETWIWGDSEESIEMIAEDIRINAGESYVEKFRRERGPEIRKYRTLARVHAFDIEAGVFVGIIGVRAGFSPGQFVDFFLGWFGVDIAGDDVPSQAGDLPVENE